LFFRDTTTGNRLFVSAVLKFIEIFIYIHTEKRKVESKMSFLSVPVPLPVASNSSGTESSSNHSPSAMGLLNQSVVSAKPKSTKKKKFKELYKVVSSPLIKLQNRY
jgi:hypothetical protein